MNKKFAKVALIALLIIVSVSILTACIPGTAEKAKEKLEKKGYSVTISNSDIELGFFTALGIKNLDAVVIADKKDSDVGHIIILYCATADSAKANKTKIADTASMIPGADSAKMTIEISGKIVYMCDEVGIKDFK